MSDAENPYDDAFLQEVIRRIKAAPSYSWQNADWPNFTWDREAAERDGREVLQSIARDAEALDALPHDAREDAVIDLMAAEAVKTSEIENEFYTLRDARASIRNQLRGLPAAADLEDPRAAGISQLMVEIGNEFNQPLSEERLCRWQSLIIEAVDDARAIETGRWRTHPVGIYAITPAGRELRYQAPPPERVPDEMERFIAWFNDARNMNGIVRAAAAHYHFECIHPFADGNGRVGRAIIDIAISQALGRRAPLSMSTAIAARRGEYYRQLEISQRASLELTRWMKWFADTARCAQSRFTGHAR